MSLGKGVAPAMIFTVNPRQDRLFDPFELSFTHISLLTEVLTVINLAAIFHNTVHLFELSTEPNEHTITV